MLERRTTGLQTFSGDAGRSLAQLNSLQGFARSLLIGVIPLLALKALGSKEAVTQAYLLASLLTITITLNFSFIERWLQRRWVITLSGLFTIIAATILLFGNGMIIALAIGLQSAAASLFTVCISLYIMDYIGRKELIYTESRRLLYTGIAWLIGPTLGIWLWNEVAYWSPFILTILASLVMVAFFWLLRLGHNPIIRKAKKNQSTSPFKIIHRYFGQPALRIAYFITLTRSIFWMSVFMYGPIYVVEAGLPNWVAGGLLSFVSGLLLLSPLIRRVANLYNVKIVIICGQCVTATALILLFFIGEPKPIGLLYWIIAALGGVILDVLSNIPFMRMVKSWERTAMTTVYSTWREGSQLLTPLLVSLVMLVAPFEVFYLTLAGLLFIASITATYLPCRL